MVRILVVEDDDAIREALTRGLAEHGATVTAVASAVEAIKALPADRPDAVMLDLGLPDLDGADVLALIRDHQRRPGRHRDRPRRRARDRPPARRRRRRLPDQAVLGGQAMARIRAVLRRTAPAASADPRVVVGGLVIDPVVAHGRASTARSSTLNRKEFDLLLALASRPGEVVSKRQLLAEVWQMPWGGADRTVDVHLSWLRRKLGETAAEPRYLHSVRGVGVKLVDPGAAMSLRGRILALTVGVAAAVLLLFAVPLVLLLHQAAAEDARAERDRRRAGRRRLRQHRRATRARSRDYVDRINDRDDAYPVEVVLADGTTHRRAACPALDEADPTRRQRGGGRDRRRRRRRVRRPAPDLAGRRATRSTAATRRASRSRRADGPVIGRSRSPATRRSGTTVEEPAACCSAARGPGPARWPRRRRASWSPGGWCGT